MLEELMKLKAELDAKIKEAEKEMDEMQKVIDRCNKEVVEDFFDFLGDLALKSSEILVDHDVTIATNVPNQSGKPYRIQFTKWDKFWVTWLTANERGNFRVNSAKEYAKNKHAIKLARELDRDKFVKDFENVMLDQMQKKAKDITERYIAKRQEMTKL